MIEQLIRPSILELKAYSSARNEFSGDGVIFLDANENPFSSDIGEVNRYPDPLQRQLKKRLAALKNIDAEQIFIGNGSDECLDVLMRTVVEPLIESVCICPPTYGIYQVLADIHRAKIIKAPLNPDFSLNLETINKSTDESTKLIFLCSPNNPSGNTLSFEAIEKLLNSFRGFVLIDEAYIDFSETQSWLTRINEFPRLIVSQTFSKAAGLAGLRLGILFAHPILIEMMNKVKYPYNINVLSQNAVCKYLDQNDSTAVNLETIISERKKLAKNLESCEAVVSVYPTQANFLLTKFIDSKAAFTSLMKNGIVVRDRSKELYCDSCLRITVGTPEENEKVIKVIRAL